MLVSEDEAIDLASSVTNAGTITVFVTNGISNLLFQSSMNMLWSALNTIQLMVHMPLLDLSYPANAINFNEPIQKIANFDLLDEF